MTLSSNSISGSTNLLPGRLRRGSFLIIITVCIIATTVLGGWIFNIELNKRPYAMNPTTAGLFLLGSISFLLLALSDSQKRIRFFGSLLAYVIIGIGFLIMLQIFLGLEELQVDLFFGKLINEKSTRMASNTAINFLLSGLALITMHTGKSGYEKLSQLIALLIGLISLVFIVGYIYQVPAFSGLSPYVPMAIHTAICFLLFSLAILFYKADKGIMRQLTSPFSGGILGRILLPLVITIPFAFVYLALWIHWQMFYSVEFEAAILVISIILAFGLVIWFSMTLLNKQDELRQQAENKLIQLNRELYATNEELALVNEKLLSGNEKLSTANSIIKEQRDVILKQKDEQFLHILQSVNDVVWSRDLVLKRNNYLSRSAEKVFDQPYEQLFNSELSFDDRVHSEDIDSKHASHQHLRATGQSECTYRIMLPKEKLRWIYDRRQLIKDINGNIIREEGVATDITALKHHQYNVDLIFNNLPEAFILLDANFAIIAFNKAAYARSKEFWHFELKEGENFVMSVAEEYRQATKERIVSAFSGETVNLEALPPYPTSNDGPFFSVNYFPLMVAGKISHVVLTAIDITQKKLDEQKLEQEHNLLRTLIDNLPDYIYVKDRQFNHLLNNRANVELMGESSEEVTLGKSVSDYFPPALAQQYIEDDRQVIMTGEPVYNKEERIVSGAGDERWLLTTKVPIRNTNQEVIGLVGISRDITERKQIEERIEESEKRFRALIENISDAIVVSDEHSYMMYQSPSVTRILGYASDQRIGKSVFDYVHEDHKQQFISLYKTLHQNPGKPFPFQFQFRHQNGHYVWLEGVIRNLLHDQSVKAYVANYHDITERKLMDEELKGNQRNLDTLINNTTDLIWLIDKDYKLVLSNKAFEDMVFVRYNKRVPVGANILTNTFDDTKEYDKWAARYESALKGEQVIIEESFTNENRKVSFHEITMNPVYDEQKIAGVGCFSRDVTERKSIEQKLKYFIEQYDVVSMATNDAIWDWYLDTDTIIWNHGVKTIFGYEEKDIVYSRTWRSENIHPDDAKVFEKEIENTFNKKRTNFSCTYRFRCSNGIFKYVFDRAYVIYENEKPIRMIGAIQDIDDRMGNLEEVKKLSLVASKTENAVAITDKNHRIEWINNSFTRLTGYKLKEAIGQKPYDLVKGEETDEVVIARIEEKLKKGESVSEELINYSRTGKKYCVKLEVTPIFNDAGELEKFISIQSDITNQKEFERNITSIARELANLIEYANTLIFGIDRNGYINEWNKVAAEITGYTKNEVYGQKLLEGIIDQTMWPVLSEQLQNVFQGMAIGNIELPIYTKNNERLIVLLNATPRRNSLSEIVGAFIVGQNITELIEYRHNLEMKVEERTRALNESLKKEKELVEMKSKFVSMVSHEFRTPLSSISLASGFIKKYKDRISKEEAEAKLDNIEKQVRHMTFLLNDILTIGKSEAGKIQAQVSPLPLKSFLQNLIRDVEQSTGATHKIKLDLDCAFETIYSDEKLLRNIIINLLTNAIKFSPQQKSVDLTVNCIDNKLQIKTKDTGMGISEEDLPNIFTAFHRGNNVGVVQGTGLGLSITKKAVDLLEGEISVKSELGKGTLFTIKLPIRHEENTVG